MSRRVVVVEDESLVAMLIEDMLADLGCAVAASVATASEALAVVAEGGADFVLLDVKLGDDDASFALADRLRALGLPFAFVTGYGALDVRADLRDAPIVSKPIDIAALARALGV